MAATPWAPTRLSQAADARSLRSKGLTVWRIRVPAAGIPPALAAVLGAGERAELDRIVAPRERQLRLAGRVCLRLLLGAWLDRDPATLSFDTGRWGKPRFPLAAGSVGFNLAHSGDLVLIAIGAGDVGVDVERSRPRSDVTGIAARFYADAEARWVAGLDNAARTEGFLRLWTRKEAVVKALGLPLPMYSAEANVLSDGRRGRTVLVEGETRHAVDWLDLEVEAGYSAAVACRGEPPEPTLREMILP